MAKSKSRATYEDLLALPEHMIGEIIDGELVATPRPAVPHATAVTAMTIDIGGPFQGPPGGGKGPGGWWFLFEPEMHFGQDVLVPDIAGWRRERLARPPGGAAMELPPDWLCEVLSPSTERFDRVRKIRVYARVKVAHVWLVNPLERTLEVMRLDGEKWVVEAVHEGDERVRAVPFDAVELELARWWPGAEAPAP